MMADSIVRIMPDGELYEIKQAAAVARTDSGWLETARALVVEAMRLRVEVRKGMEAQRKLDAMRAAAQEFFKLEDQYAQSDTLRQRREISFAKTLLRIEVNGG